MGKSDLIGGSLWEHYSNKVSDRMNNPRHMGEITPAEAEKLGAELVVADHGAESCGDAVRLYWAVDPKSGRILDAKFKSFGCGTAIASSDMMAEMCLGKTVDEALGLTNIEVEAALRDDPNIPAVPPQKMHCSVMAYDVIKRAAANFKRIDISQLEEEDLVCECARVTLGTIKDVIKLNDLKTVEEITNYTKAGAFCKSCIHPGGHEKRAYYLEDILRETRAEMERAKTGDKDKAPAFSGLNLIRKHKAVEEVLEKSIRPMLAGDGGSVEVTDMKEEEGRVRVYISYGGACSGCASRLTGTLAVIQEQLRSQLDPAIDVAVL